MITPIHRSGLDEVLEEIRHEQHPFSFICTSEERCRALVDLLREKLGRTESVYEVSRSPENVFNNLKVLDNLFIKERFISQAQRRQQRMKYMLLKEKFGIPIEPERVMGSLTGEEKYIIELLRIVLSKPDVAILSSISPVLGFRFFECFMNILADFREKNTRVIIVSTRWEDTVQICDRVAVESGIERDCYSMMRMFDIKKDPRILFYALADYEEQHAPSTNSIAALNAMMDMTMMQNHSWELGERILSVIRVVREQLAAIDGVVCLRDKNGNLNSYYNRSENPERCMLVPGFMQNMLNRSEKASFFTRSKYDFEDIFIQTPSDVEMLVSYPIISSAEKIGVVVLMFSKNYILSDEQVATIRVCSRMISNLVFSASAANSSVMIEESNHRVKNNLQMIVSMLYIQRQVYHGKGRPASISTEEMDSFIDNMVNRIRMIAEMHNFVARNYEELDKISAYEIVNTVLRNYQGFTVRFSTDVEHILMPYDKASSAAMILNEVVCNSIKHAFEDGSGEGGSDNRIHIAFSRTQDGVEILVQDNGRGLPEMFDSSRSNSLGMKIIHSQSSRLKAKLSFSNCNGTQVCLRFPLERRENA